MIRLDGRIEADRGGQGSKARNHEKDEGNCIIMMRKDKNYRGREAKTGGKDCKGRKSKQQKLSP